MHACIEQKEEGKLIEVLRKDNYKDIIPSAHNLEDAIKFMEKLYETIEGIFTAYYFKLEE